eukprot:s1109_g7.t1
MRNLLVISGDFNSELAYQSPYVGPAAFRRKRPLHRDVTSLHNLLEEFNLTALNTWGPSRRHTYQHGDYRSQIDYCFARRSQSRGQSKASGPLRQWPLAAWRQHTDHLPLHLSFAAAPWRPPIVAGRPYNIKDMDSSYRAKDGRHTAFTTKLVREAGLITEPTWAKLEEALQRAAASIYPTRPKMKQKPEVLTLFADDILHQEHFRTWDELEAVLARVTCLFQVLRDLGLEVNPSKSSIMLSLQGTQSQQARDFLYVKLKNQLYLTLPDGSMVPVQRQITPAKRLWLWSLYVNSSLLYGLPATGITSDSQAPLHQVHSAQVRSVLLKHQHYSREPTDAILAKHRLLTLPQQVLDRTSSHDQAGADGKSQDNNLEDEQDCVVIAQDVRPGLSESAEKSLLQSAAAVWRSNCGRTRSSGESRQQRWDAGMARTAIVDQAASSEPGPLARLPKTVTSADSIMASLTPKLLAEIDFNQEKEAKAKVEAYLQGHLLPAEITPDLADKSTAFLQKIAKAQRERNNKNRNVKSKVLKDEVGSCRSEP